MFVSPPTPNLVSNDLEQPHWRQWLSRLRWQTVGCGLLVVAGLVSIGLSVWWRRGNSTTFHQVKVSTESSSASPSATIMAQSAKSQIYVDVAGAVQHPGLYQLDTGSRLAALIEQAGGFSKAADTQYISQELNLAQALKDGDKIYVYNKSEAQAKRFAATPTATTKAGTGTAPAAQLISLNSASQKELESLAGIGAKRAADIVAGRPFASIDELVSKQLVSQTVFDDIQPFLTL